MTFTTTISSTEPAKFEELNSDILSQIYEEVTIQNRDEVAFFKIKYDKFAKDNKATDEEVDDWIYNYIKNLSQNQVNAVMCNYGINKAVKLMYDFHKIGMGDSDAEFCEELMHHPADRYMVDLIFKDEVKFMSDWRENDKK